MSIAEIITSDVITFYFIFIIDSATYTHTTTCIYD